MLIHSNGSGAFTSMADAGNQRPLRGDGVPSLSGGGRPLPARPLHDVGAGGDGAPVAGRAPAGRGAAVRGGRVPAHARSAKAPQDDRLTIAVPAKGRLREPSISLLDDAGLGPEEPGERALAFPCRNAPVDVLLVRAADVP